MGDCSTNSVIKLLIWKIHSLPRLTWLICVVVELYKRHGVPVFMTWIVWTYHLAFTNVIVCVQCMGPWRHCVLCSYFSLCLYVLGYKFYAFHILGMWVPYVILWRVIFRSCLKSWNGTWKAVALTRLLIGSPCSPRCRSATNARSIASVGGWVAQSHGLSEVRSLNRWLWNSWTYTKQTQGPPVVFARQWMSMRQKDVQLTKPRLWLLCLSVVCIHKFYNYY